MRSGDWSVIESLHEVPCLSGTAFNFECVAWSSIVTTIAIITITITITSTIIIIIIIIIITTTTTTTTTIIIIIIIILIIIIIIVTTVTIAIITITIIIIIIIIIIVNIITTTTTTTIIAVIIIIVVIIIATRMKYVLLWSDVRWRPNRLFLSSRRDSWTNLCKVVLKNRRFSVRRGQWLCLHLPFTVVNVSGENYPAVPVM